MRIPSISKEDFDLSVGQHIKKLRIELLNETQSELAQRLSINQVTVANYERNHQLPKMSVLRGLAEIADEKGYVAGSATFRRLASARAETNKLAEETKRLVVSEAGLKAITNLLASAKAAWSCLPPDLQGDANFIRHHMFMVGRDISLARKELRKLMVEGSAE
jgi:transcriptional regulator with XRE-family HTH domain